jgi:hypothetical protein
MRRTCISLAVVAGCCVAGLITWLNLARARPDKPAEEAPKAKAEVPVTQVVLFNTGVAYFQRQGDVEGKQRLELSFPMTDLNDLLKSMTVDDGGKPGAIGYDGADPIEQGLKSFAVDLTGNPTLGQILNQSRGEKVEVTFDPQPGAAAAPLTGTVVGMEASVTADKETHALNLLCADGLRRIGLERVQRVRFLDPDREREFRRALGMLAAGNSGQRRRVWAELRGDGKRTVKVGYVLEAPIWKATYRLALGDKPLLEARAIVENTTEEDWKDVKVTLVAGRPITFEMDLSKPLFVPRPPQQPEFYASLAPPTHGNPLDEEGLPMGRFRGNVGFGGNLGQLGGQFGLMGGGFNLGGASQIGGMITSPMISGLTTPTTFGPGSMLNRYQIAPTPVEAPRLTFAELVERRNAMIQKRQTDPDQAKADAEKVSKGVEEVALTADRIGDGFHRAIEQKVSIPRQSSAMLPLMKEAIEVTRFSVFNKDVHPRFPMYTLKLKNTTDQALLQGPVSVSEGGAFVGDCKLPDMAPGDERLVSYAVDLGVEVRTEKAEAEEKKPQVTIHKGRLVTVPLWRRMTFVSLMSRAKAARALVYEHPIEGQWKPSGKAVPAEATKTHRRYEFKAAPGVVTRDVIEEESSGASTSEPVLKVSPETWAALLKTEVSPAMKAAIEKIIALREAAEKATKAALEAKQHAEGLEAEQRRLKERIDKLPAGSAARKRLTDEYDQQEQQLDKYVKQARTAREEQAKAERERDAFYADVTAK